MTVAQNPILTNEPDRLDDSVTLLVQSFLLPLSCSGAAYCQVHSIGVVRVLPVVSSIREVPTSAILATVASFVSSMFLDLMSL